MKEKHHAVADENFTKSVLIQEMFIPKFYLSKFFEFSRNFRPRKFGAIWYVHRLELKEIFENEQLQDLDAASDEDKAKGSNDGQKMLIECNVLTDKSYMPLSQVGTPAECDSLLLMD